MTASERTSSSDDDLLRLLRGGDEPAFTALYRKWRAPLYRFALRMSGREALAEGVGGGDAADLCPRPCRSEHGIDHALAAGRFKKSRWIEGGEPPGDTGCLHHILLRIVISHISILIDPSGGSSK